MAMGEYALSQSPVSTKSLHAPLQTSTTHVALLFLKTLVLASSNCVSSLATRELCVCVSACLFSHLKVKWSKQNLLLVRLSLACVTSWPAVVSQMLYRSRSCACQVGQSVGLSGRKWSGGAASWSVCPLFFFLFFFSFLCFAKVGFTRGNCHCIRVIGGRETRCLGSARVYALLIFSEVSILLTQWLPVSFLPALIFIEIVPNWESTVLGPESNSTNL